METKRICKDCGAPLAEEAFEGLCPKCLLKAGMGTQPGSQPANEPASGSNPAESLPDPARLAEFFPQLEILELVGQGGMGAVYKARQPALDRLVALKILPARAARDPGFAERFTREARALARLSHPNIVAIYDFGQTHGLHYFLMEYVDGTNLRQLEQAGKLSPREALQIIPRICEALQYAHDEGIVHRDIKPENVLLDKKGKVKIADFGLAKILGHESKAQRLTGARDVMGTPHYMAPEQVEHPQAVDHRADIYSLGVVFYEMLTGELPLGKFAPPSARVRGVTVDVRLDEVVLHALEKEPERRYQQAIQVKTDVENIAGTGGTRAAAAEAPPPGAESPALEAAWRQVRGPANGLVVAGLLNWMVIPLIALLATYLLAGRSGASATWMLAVLLAFVLGTLIFVAGLKMRRLETYPLALLGSMLAVLVTPGNLIGLPVGIWALVVLSRREVRLAFRSGGYAGPPAREISRHRPEFWKVAVGTLAATVTAGLLLLGSLLVVSLALPALSRAKARSGQRQQQLAIADPSVPSSQNRAIDEAAPSPPGPSLELNVPPVVLRTVPESGTAGVDPALTELRVTFSAPMRDQSWSWTSSDADHNPQTTGPPRFLSDGRTCILPVKLRPGQVYALWLNSETFHGFQDRDGHPALPYLLIFATRK